MPKSYWRKKLVLRLRFELSRSHSAQTELKALPLLNKPNRMSYFHLARKQPLHKRSTTSKEKKPFVDLYVCVWSGESDQPKCILCSKANATDQSCAKRSNTHETKSNNKINYCNLWLNDWNRSTCFDPARWLSTSTLKQFVR